MSALAVLVPLALGLGLLALIFYGWTLRTGQYDDPDGAANRILFDDPEEPSPCPDPPNSR
jgi:cbb3-type cytochrome oxidase maturation protein